MKVSIIKFHSPLFDSLETQVSNEYLYTVLNTFTVLVYGIFTFEITISIPNSITIESALTKIFK